MKKEENEIMKGLNLSPEAVEIITDLQDDGCVMLKSTLNTLNKTIRYLSLIGYGKELSDFEKIDCLATVSYVTEFLNSLESPSS